MTRVKEVQPGSDKMPDYKSTSGRLVHSLRKGYDNLRVKLSQTRKKIKYHQIKTRDLEISRNKYKTENKILEERMRELEKENHQLKEKAIEKEEKKRNNFSS